MQLAHLFTIVQPGSSHAGTGTQVCRTPVSHGLPHGACWFRRDPSRVTMVPSGINLAFCASENHTRQIWTWMLVAASLVTAKLGHSQDALRWVWVRHRAHHSTELPQPWGGQAVGARATWTDKTPPHRPRLQVPFSLLSVTGPETQRGWWPLGAGEGQGCEGGRGQHWVHVCVHVYTRSRGADLSKAVSCLVTVSC